MTSSSSSRRPNVIATRISDAGWAQIEKLRVDYDTDTASVARALFAVALQHPTEVRDLLKQQI